MPKVGDKHFAYSKKGKKAAKAYAKKTGQSVGKYEAGGGVDPFSLRNPKGVPVEQAKEAIVKANMPTSDEQEQGALPTLNAQERSQTSPDVTEYNEGGKVKSKKINVTDVVKKAGEWEGFYYPKREEFSEPSKVHQIDVIHAGRKRKKEAVKKLAKKALKGKKK